jgi:hypothetical protein
VYPKRERTDEVEGPWPLKIRNANTQTWPWPREKFQATGRENLTFVETEQTLVIKAEGSQSKDNLMVEKQRVLGDNRTWDKKEKKLMRTRGKKTLWKQV